MTVFIKKIKKVYMIVIVNNISIYVYIYIYKTILPNVKFIYKSKALSQTTFKCTWRLNRTRWTTMSHDFHAVICSIPQWIILLVFRIGSSQLDSLKTQSRILRYLPFQTKNIFQSCDKTTKLLDHNLYFIAYTSVNNGNQPIFFCNGLTY